MEKSRILINKKVVEKTKSVEVVGDIIVPDIKPDIVNIINTNGNSYVYKEDISQDNLRKYIKENVKVRWKYRYICCVFI